MRKILMIMFLCFTSSNIYSQNTALLISEVSLDSLVKTVRELSGEDSTQINDSTVRIKHRISKIGNDMAADYLVERLEALGLVVDQHNYRKGGRNIIATLPGKINPDSIFILGGHYDAAANFSADDNASGSSAVLEAARIMSKYCFKNTVRFAFWDEEERGLVGSHFYADTALAQKQQILGVVNADMFGYDGDSDKVFDIHADSMLRNLALKDTILYVLDSFNIDLVPNVINPGTTRSDHASFWNTGYPAVFFGESFLGGDPNPAYHTSKDRINLFDLDYFYNLSHLTIGIIVELAGLIPTSIEVDTIFACDDFEFAGSTLTMSGIYHDSLKTALGCDSIHSINLTITRLNDSITQEGRTLSAVDSGVHYRWLDCNRIFPKLKEDTLQSFLITRDGSFAVEVSENGCKDTSDCFELIISSAYQQQLSTIKAYPNPTEKALVIELGEKQDDILAEVYSSSGKLISRTSYKNVSEFSMDLTGDLGLYIVRISSNSQNVFLKIVKQ
jgi:Peptidase family M28/Secretion system C-terminal sorting domain